MPSLGWLSPNPPPSDALSLNPSLLNPSIYYSSPTHLQSVISTHLHSGYQEIKDTFETNNPKTTMRNPRHYYALFMKKGAKNDFKQAITKDYTANLLQNMNETPDFKEFCNEHKDIRADKGLLKMVNENDRLKEKFNIFNCLGITNMETDQEVAEVFGYKNGKFNNFQICNVLTKNDIKQLGILYDSFLHHQLWGMHQWQIDHCQSPASATKHKLRFCFFFFFLFFNIFFLNDKNTSSRFYY